MITGEIAILFASAAGIGAAAATWVYDRRLVKRLTDLRRDVRRLESLADAYGGRLTQTTAAINKLRQPLSPDIYAKVADDIRTDLAKAKALGVRPEGKSPDPEAKHPLYAKTGLPNQPVASLRPETPTPCTKCHEPRVWKQGWMNGKTPVTRPWCESCQETELSDGTPIYCGYQDDPPRRCLVCGYAGPKTSNAYPCPNCGD